MSGLGSYAVALREYLKNNKLPDEKKREAFLDHLG